MVTCFPERSYLTVGCVPWTGGRRQTAPACGGSPSAAFMTAARSMRSSTKGSSATSACFVDDGQPYVIPTLYARLGDEIYFHGSAASRMLHTLDGGVDACLDRHARRRRRPRTSDLQPLDQLQVRRRLGRATAVTVVAEKRRALEAFSGRLLPGRWADVGLPRRRSSRRPRSCAYSSTKPPRRSAPPAAGQRGGLRLAGLGGRDPARTHRRRTAAGPGARARIRASAVDAQRTRSAEDRPKRPIGGAGQPR
jgi:nitroimidazol reductase NimA-like FMN-containing flavoprotein (pyridoxamine 5'-phosphate oxidase superfamily)